MGCTVLSVECSRVESVKWKVWSERLKCGVESVKYKVWGVKFKAWSVKCKV